MNIEPKYKHLVQKPQFCFPTIVSMVCLRKGYWLDQEDIAKDLGIKVTKKVSKSFNYKFEIAKNILEAGYDVGSIDVKKLNTIFKKHKIPIIAEFKKISEINDVDEFILENIKNNNDLGMLFLWKAFGKKVDYGHYVLVLSYNSKTKIVEVCDPASEGTKSFWSSKISKFMSGMSSKWDGKERGFIIFKDSKK
jgi:hypothetical protein